MKDQESSENVLFYGARLLLVFFVCACASGGCTWLNKKLNVPNDHPAEQYVESWLKNETGIDIDLTPEE